MAGDWIKMRVWLAKDPKVIRMADRIITETDFMNWLTGTPKPTADRSRISHVRGVTCHVLVTGLLQVWGMASERGERDGRCDLIVTHCDLATLDDISGMPGFGSAMADVGWVVNEGSNLRFPGYLRDNTCVEDRNERAREQARERKQRQRDRERDRERDKSVIVTDREEKRREEKKREEGKSPLPPVTIDVDPTGLSEAMAWLGRWSERDRKRPLIPHQNEHRQAEDGLRSLANCPPIPHGGKPTSPLLLVPTVVDGLMAKGTAFKGVRWALACIASDLDEWRTNPPGGGRNGAPAPPRDYAELAKGTRGGST